MFVKKKLLATLSLLLLLLPVLTAISQKSNWIAFDAAIEPAKPKVEVLESNTSKTVLSITVPGMEVSEQFVAEQAYQRLSFPDYGTTTEVGQPELPIVGAFVAIPWDKGAMLKILTVQLSVLNGYTVYPFQEHTHSSIQEFSLDGKVYSQDAFYPGKLAEISEPGILRDYRIVHLIVYPVQYNPVWGELKVYKQITVQLDYAPEPMTPEVQMALNRPHVITPEFDRIYRDVIVNYEPLSAPSTQSDYMYLIITPDEYYDNILPLKNYYDSYYWVHIAKLGMIGSTPTAIRLYIIDKYNYCPLAYVLLVGDDEKLPAYDDGTRGLTPYWGDHQYAALDSPQDQY